MSGETIILTAQESARKAKLRSLENSLKRCPEFMEAFNDPATVELVLNADGRLWQERLGEKLKKIGYVAPDLADRWMSLIAGFRDMVVTADQPILETEFPLDGSRFAGLIPPVVTAPTFSIRKPASKVFALETYVESGVMSECQYHRIVEAVRNHRNILVVGGTGSGKTTLSNAIIREVVKHFPHERIVIIEDTREIQCEAANYAQFRTSSNISMTQLLRTTLRMRPDRILVGEVRGPEALDLLDSWNTGHEGGIATIHANNSYAGLTRLRSLITRNDAAPDEIEPLIAEAVHVVINISRHHRSRKVNSVLEIEGWDAKTKEYIFRDPSQLVEEERLLESAFSEAVTPAAAV